MHGFSLQLKVWWVTLKTPRQMKRLQNPRVPFFCGSQNGVLSSLEGLELRNLGTPWNLGTLETMPVSQLFVWNPLD